MSKRSRRSRRSSREVINRNRPRRKPQSSQRKRTPRNIETTKYIQEPIKKKKASQAPTQKSSLEGFFD